VEKKDDRRRSLVVNRSLQYRFLAMMLAYLLILIFFLGITLFLPEIMQMRNDTLSMAVRGAAAERILSKHVWVWPIVFLLAALIGVHSFRAFQKVAGPLYRFKWAFEEVRKGNLNFLVKIRKKDYLHDEEELLNEMLEALRTQVRNAKRINLDLIESFKKIQSAASGKADLDPSIKDALETHRQNLEKVSAAFSYFKVDNGRG